MEIRPRFDTLLILADMQHNLSILQRAKATGKKTVELKIEKWATPLGLLPIAIHANRLHLNVTYGRNKTGIRSYLEGIRFPEGTPNLNWARSSSYLPLTRLSPESDDETLTRYEELILKGIKEKEIRDSFRNALKYLTSELVTNIKEHAHTDRYWILAQYWPKTETCQIAIADTGIGYLESYRNTEYEVSTHKEAITNAINGNSSKHDVERGAGIPGMVKILCEGYGGDIVIMSGDPLLYLNRENSDFYTLDVPWSGAFVGLQFKLSVINALAYLV